MAIDGKYAIVFNGKTVYYLNSNLAKRQQVTDDELEQLKQLHQSKLQLFEEAKTAAAADDTIALKIHVLALEHIEYAMQRTWHFSEDRTFHEWYNLPGCACPKMDNADSRGVDRRIVVRDCPAHGF